MAGSGSCVDEEGKLSNCACRARATACSIARALQVEFGRRVKVVPSIRCEHSPNKGRAHQNADSATKPLSQLLALWGTAQPHGTLAPPPQSHTAAPVMSATSAFGVASGGLDACGQIRTRARMLKSVNPTSSRNHQARITGELDTARRNAHFEFAATIASTRASATNLWLVVPGFRRRGCTRSKQRLPLLKYDDPWRARLYCHASKAQSVHDALCVPKRGPLSPMSVSIPHIALRICT